MTLHNDDGSIWHEFNTRTHYQTALDKPILRYPNHLSIREKAEFRPYSLGKAEPPQTVILRLIGESDNWYEVEVNEDTQATKFAPKKEMTWSRTTWDFFLRYDRHIVVNNDRTKLHDSPNGKVIDNVKAAEIIRFSFHRMDGEWMFGIAHYSYDKREGWIRWRNGRQLLVGCFFNASKVPKIDN